MSILAIIIMKGVSHKNNSIQLVFDNFLQSSNSEIVATSEYDILGRQTKLIDVNAGTIEYAYNAFGDVVETINANGEVKTYIYDDFGRLLQTNNNGIVVDYEYIETGNGINKVEKISTADHEQTFEYDGLNRVIKTTEIINGSNFEFEYLYNSLNQVTQIIYPNGLVVNNSYDNNGYLIEVQDQNMNTLWEGIEQDAFGRYVTYKKGDGITTELYFDAFQNLAEIEAGNVQHHVYNWSAQTGNLMQRQDLIKNLYEEFQYDNLNRLTKAQDEVIAMGPPPTVFSEVEYESNGNISYKSDAGEYAYHPTKPNAVTGVSNDNLNISLLTQDITYNAFNKAETIEENGYELAFLYGYDKQRRKTSFSENVALVLEKYFVGLYEKEIFPYNTTLSIWDWDFHEHNLSRSLDLINMFSEAYEFSSLSEENSLAELIPITIEMSSSGNGRIYDPILGRMLSPDNFVQDPLFSQSYNRYSYAWNNPLRYSDPSGEVVVAGIIIGAIAGGYMGGAIANNTINIAEWEWDKNTAIGIAGGALIGAGIGAGIGAAFAGNLGPKAMAIAHLNAPVLKSGLASGGLNMMYNYEEGQSLGTSLGYFGSGFAGGIIGFEVGTLVGMIAGGTGNVGVLGADKGSEATFREYAQKFVSGAINSYVGPELFANEMFGQQVNYMTMADGSYFGGSIKVAKAWRFGWLNQASDFAHSSQDAFQNRSFAERAMMFGGAGASTLRGPFLRISGYFIQQTIHATFSNNPDYLPLNYEYSHRKLFILLSKNLFYNLK